MVEGFKKGSFYMSAGWGVYGGLMILFNVFAARILSPDGYGLISILYSMILLTSFLLTSGLTTSLTKFVPELEGKKQTSSIPPLLEKVLKGFILVITLFLVVCAVIHENVTIKMLNGVEHLLFVYLTAVIIVSGLNLSQALLQGLRELRASSIVLCVRGLTALSALGLVTLIGKTTPNNVATIFILTPLTALLCATWLLKKRKNRIIGEKSGALMEPPPGLTSFVVYSHFVGLSSISVLFLGPIIVKTLGTGDVDRAAGLLTAGINLFRPLPVVFAGLFLALFPNLSRAVGAKDKQLVDKYLRKTTMLVVGSTLFVVVAAGVVGPWVVETIYGREYTLSRADLVLLAFAVGGLVVARMLTRFELAMGRVKSTTICWVAALTLGLVYVTIFREPIIRRTEEALCIITGATSLLLGLLHTSKRETWAHS